jgi:hypothetical protein
MEMPCTHDSNHQLPKILKHLNLHQVPWNVFAPHVVEKNIPQKPNEQLTKAEAKIVYLSKVIGFASTQSEEAKNRH